MTQPHTVQLSEEFLEALDLEIELLLCRAIKRCRMNGRKRLMSQDV
jgi:hypothetical protein